MATKLAFLKNMAIGDIVAFRCKGKMLSAKVVKIESEVQLSPKNEEYDVVLETRNGSCYCVMREDIAWVRKGNRWPDSIYLALKMKKEQTNG